MQHVADVGSLDLEADRPHEFQHLDDDGVRELRLAHDVGQERLRVARVRHLAPQQPGHDLDARQRILELVRDAGRHLAERAPVITAAVALFELFDLRQILEEQHGADRAAPSSLTCESELMPRERDRCPST